MEFGKLRDVAGHGVFAGEAHHDGEVGAVAFAGFGEGAEEMDGDGGDFCEVIGGDAAVEEALGGAPGAHGVGTAGTYADFENVEDGDRFHGGERSEGCV